MQKWTVIYQYPGLAVITPKKPNRWIRFLGLSLFTLALGGFIGPLIPAARLETSYAISQATNAPLAKPDPAPQDALIPQDFRLVISKIGIDAPVIANVDPTGGYNDALLSGVAHASTSFLPSEDGTVYLFSHSTNYDWFVKDLNAVFYLLKNLEPGDDVTLYHEGKQYDYVIREKKIVNPRDISYLVPQIGTKNLILETCWPPGSVSQRLLVFADLINNHGN